jgi:hypothetical protein
VTSTTSDQMTPLVEGNPEEISRFLREGSLHKLGHATGCHAQGVGHGPRRHARSGTSFEQSDAVSLHAQALLDVKLLCDDLPFQVGQHLPLGVVRGAWPGEFAHAETVARALGVNERLTAKVHPWPLARDRPGTQETRVRWPHAEPGAEATCTRF